MSYDYRKIQRTRDMQTGAVVVFRADITPDQAREILAKLGDVLESQDVQRFEPQYGGPVFYCP